MLSVAAAIRRPSPPGQESHKFSARRKFSFFAPFAPFAPFRGNSTAAFRIKDGCGLSPARSFGVHPLMNRGFQVEGEFQGP